MGFITTPVYIKTVKLPDQSMISARLRSILRIQVNPFVLQSFILCQIIKVDATFPSITSKEKYTVLKRNTMST